jgi:hypothetical protein
MKEISRYRSRMKPYRYQNTAQGYLYNILLSNNQSTIASLKDSLDNADSGLPVSR